MGGQNSQDSILERRSMLWNDNEVEAPDAPPSFWTGVEDKGKFFPRGCRGHIETIWVYCRRGAAGDIRLSYSPHPSFGRFGTFTITPGADWAWVPVTVNRFWDYDSLFIWLWDVDADVEWGYDVALPYDGWESPDDEATWAAGDYRPFIRVVIKGETPGDVPVSGIVNTIALPKHTTASSPLDEFEVPGNGSAERVFFGAGKVHYVWWHVSTDAARDAIAPYVEVDGNKIQPDPVGMNSLHHYLVDNRAFEGITWPRWDENNTQYTLQWKLDIPFLREARIGCDNTAAGARTVEFFMLVYLLR